MQPRRILKTSSALFGAQGIILGTQLILPPLFLHSYGVANYGEWLTLSASVNYLGTLNFGLQTFTNNRVSISHARGEFDEVKSLQATAFGLLSSIVITASIFSLLVFLLPISSWLKLQASSQAASCVVYFLSLQILSKMIFGFLAGSFLAIGVSYRGNYWNNAQALVSFLGTALLAFRGISFSSIAIFQFATMFLFTVLVAFDLRFKAPSLFPQLSHFQSSRIKEILKPSGYFALLFSSTFLVFQVPVIVMQRILGPQNVVVFSLTRTIYSMSRQILTSMSQAIAPEIVELYGKGNWPRLLRLYDLSERAVFAFVPVITIGTFLASPILIAAWLHKPALYDVHICIYMALISAVMGIKEHKYQFQTSANQHVEMARFMFGGYLALIVLSIPAIQWFGVCGFLALWLATEVSQVIFILHLNRRFFQHIVRLDFKPVLQLATLMAAGMVLGGIFALADSRRSLLETGAVTALASIALFGIAYQVFKVHEISSGLLARVLRRA